VEAILKAASLKKKGARLAVTGCLAARFGPDLGEALPEADLILPPGRYDDFALWVAHSFGSGMPPAAGPFETWERRRGTPPWRAWLKAAEGCDHRCAYCLIPALRGPFRARPLTELLEETEGLVASGVKEVTVVAQDLTAWRDKDLGLADLARELSGIKDLAWLRLMYAYPERLTEAMVKSLAQIPKLTPYLDVPVQHASPAVLRRMGRKPGDPVELTKKLRRLWPGVALRTTLMVGFPGETEADFDLLVRLIEEGRFDHAGVFKFSPEEGVRASTMPGQIPKMVKEKRRRTLMARQRRVSLALNRARVGSLTEILVEGASEESDLVMTGRGPFQAPEVDGIIYFDGEQPAAGDIVGARLIKAAPYDLVARLAPGDH
jgi:ribosomal protein S12 methylthiotransferase